MQIVFDNSYYDASRKCRNINFILEFENDYIVNSTYNLTIPQEFKLEWVDVSIPLAEYNKVSMVEFEVTNLGNEKISDKLEIILPNGWDSQFEDTNWIVLNPEKVKGFF